MSQNTFIFILYKVKKIKTAQSKNLIDFKLQTVLSTKSFKYFILGF